MASAAELEVTRQAVEQACNATEASKVREAEATFVGLSHSAHAIQVCQYILEVSRTQMACFYAAGALQEATLREWPRLSSSDHAHILGYCLSYTVDREGVDPLVFRRMAGITAALFKRGWMESSNTEKDAFFTHIEGKAHGSFGSSSSAQRHALALLQAVVVEFSPGSSTTMKMSSSFHESCRASLEAQYLMNIYGIAREVAKKAAVQTAQGVSEAADLCATALRLLLQLIQWESFDTSRSGREGSSIRSQKRGPVLEDMLAAPQNIAWLLEFYHFIRGAGISSRVDRWSESSVAVGSRELLVQICSSCGRFKDSDVTQVAYVQQMLLGISGWLSPPEAVIEAVATGGLSSELLNGCDALAELASKTSVATFDASLAGTEHGGGVPFLVKLTCATITRGGSTQEGTSLSEVFQLLLEAWSSLLEPDLKYSKVQSRSPHPSVVQGAATVVECYLETELRAAAASAEEEEAYENWDEAVAARDVRLSSVAPLARACPQASLQLLTLRLKERQEWLVESARQRMDPTGVMEELHTLLLLSGHCLADSGASENPMIPEALEAAFESVGDANMHPIVGLSRSVLDLACLVLQEDARRIFSPRLVEAVVWFLARWADTYLIPGNNAAPWHLKDVVRRGQVSEEAQKRASEVGSGSGSGNRALEEAFGEDGGGPVALQAVMAVAVVALTAWPGETILQGLVCSKLLFVLVRRRKLCSRVIQLEQWRQLEKAFAESDVLAALPAKLHRSLAQVVCAAAADDKDRCNERLSALMGYTCSNLITLAKRDDFRSIAQRPDILRQVSCMLERLRGAARGCKAHSQKAILQLGFSLRETMIQLLSAYTNQPSVVYLILKFWVEWVETEMAYLSNRESGELLHFCMCLLQVYADKNCGKISLEASQSLAREAQSEKYKDIRALLQLLINISSKDLVDFNQTSEGEEKVDIAKVVFMGLQIVLPLITVDLLRLPKLCHQYFCLLEHLISVHPEKMAELPPELFSTLFQTLEFGLGREDPEVVTLCLKGIDALATWQLNARSQGNLGLYGRVQSEGGPNAGKMLVAILSVLFRSLLCQDISSSLVEPTADALLPLVICEPLEYRRMVDELLSSQPPQVQQQLHHALLSLPTINEKVMTLNRNERRQFRMSLQELLPVVRGAVRTR